jgi:hypothetical protein
MLKVFQDWFDDLAFIVGHERNFVRVPPNAFWEMLRYHPKSGVVPQPDFEQWFEQVHGLYKFDRFNTRIYFSRQQDAMLFKLTFS